MSRALRRLLDKKIAAAASMVVSAIVARLSLPGVVGSAAQAVVIAAAILGVLMVTWQEVRRRTGWVLAVLACVGLLVALPTMASFLIHKQLEIDRRIPASAALASRLADSCPRVIHPTDYNTITRVGRPLVGRDGQGRIHVLLDFEWRKKEKAIIGEHTYEGSAYLEAGTRTTEDGTLMESFVLGDLSIGPKRGFWAYFLGWYEAPFLKSEGRLVSQWVSACLGAG